MNQDMEMKQGANCLSRNVSISGGVRADGGWCISFNHCELIQSHISKSYFISN